MDLPILDEAKVNIKYLFEIYSNTCKLGGIVNVIASNLFAPLMEKVKSKDIKLSPKMFII